MNSRAPRIGLVPAIVVREAPLNERNQRELRQAGGDAFSAAFELIITPVIFGLAGWFIDSRLGLFPVFTLALGLIVLAYQVWRLWSQYETAMDAELEARRATYGQRPPA